MQNVILVGGHVFIRCTVFQYSSEWLTTSPRMKTMSEVTEPDSQVHGANVGPTWGRQDPGGPHVGPMNFVIWEVLVTIATRARSNTYNLVVAYVVNCFLLGTHRDIYLLSWILLYYKIDHLLQNCRIPLLVHEILQAYTKPSTYEYDIYAILQTQPMALHVRHLSK